MSELTSFVFEGVELEVRFVESEVVATGVTCGVYRFVGDKRKDLGIIYIEKGHSTPRQEVMKGKRTVEGYVSGRGTLTIWPKDGAKRVYPVGGNPYFQVDVEVGDIMQWEALSGSNLVASEVCIPRYKPGRFRNLVG